MQTIRDLRKQADKTQPQIAKRTGVSQAAYSRWERGEAVPSIDKWPALARSLGVTIAQLFDALYATRYGEAS